MITSAALAAIAGNLEAIAQRTAPPLQRSGRLHRLVGYAMEAAGCHLAIGEGCRIERPGGDLEAEVVGFRDGRALLMPLGDVRGVIPGAAVNRLARTATLPVGPGVLGHVLDALGRPIDGRALGAVAHADLEAPPINPLTRRPIDTPIDVGVRAINALLTVGRGQRIGLFAGSGVGKSTLLGMMCRHCDAEVIVVGLVGERGREVGEFIEHNLDPATRARTVMVVAPADEPPLLRMRAALAATRIAEQFRADGRHVLLIMDSLTRFSQAQREVALAAGEPPATRGYPPSVFAALPKLVERTGNDAGPGSITAFYTVLVEGDDLQDPVADTARAILDGHIVLDRRLAEQNWYPAIDLERSISRLMGVLATPAHREVAGELRHLLARYNRDRDLIAVGAYQKGADPELDRAIDRMAAIRAFVNQPTDERTSFGESVARLEAVVRGR